MHIIFGLGAFQTFIFSLLLLTKKNKMKADKFLAGFFFVITLYLLNIYSVKFNIWKKYPDIISVITLVSLSYGPLLYFYVRSLTGKEISRKQILFHLIPIIGIYLIILPFLFHSKEEKLLYFTDKFINLPLNVSIGTFFQYLSAPFYFTWIIVLLRKHKQSLKDNLSSIDKVNLNWMRKLLYGVITILLIDCFNGQAMNFSNLEFPHYLSLYIKIVFLLFIIAIGYHGINQGSIFSSLHHFQGTVKNNSKNEKVKSTSNETTQQQTEILVKYMQQEKVYLNSELRIQDISVDLNIPVHVLSQIINTNLNQNFYDFVNTHRIEEVKSRLKDSSYNDLTIVAIANDCGFNSKATFNRLFKKHTNLTPTQYKKG